MIKTGAQNLPEFDSIRRSQVHLLPGTGGAAVVDYYIDALELRRQRLFLVEDTYFVPCAHGGDQVVVPGAGQFLYWMWQKQNLQAFHRRLLIKE